MDQHLETTKREFQIQGHRGGYKPDNVIATFKKSLENGLEAIELDVRPKKFGMSDVQNLKNYPSIGVAHLG
jgi:glycerophosphoryl diester phosphodiesterase